MPRLRLWPLAVALRARAALAFVAGVIVPVVIVRAVVVPALVASVLAGLGLITTILIAPGLMTSAFAESGSPLLRPQLDGDPKRPPRFQRAGSAKDARADTLSTTSFQPAAGAGNTGFDSSGKRKAKGQAKGQATGQATGQAKGKASAAAKAAPLPSPPSRYGSPVDNLLAPGPAQIAVPRLPSGVARKGASPYFTAAEVTTDLPQRRRPVPDETPFEPTGIQVGAFNFKPAIEVTGGYDTNPARVLNATPSWYSVVAPELKFNSNWARHEFTGDLRGSYSAYEALESQNRPSLDSKLTGRIDVTRDTRVDLETKVLVGTDNPGSPNIQAGLAKLPIFTTWGGTAGLGHRFNRFDIAAKGGVERTVYQDSTFTDGSTASNEDRNYNRYNLQLRGSYELTPGVKPFVEVGGDRRVHDLDIDFTGQQRNSNGGYVKGGSTFELTRIVTGDVAVGWLERHYEDPTLPKLAGLTFDASLTWVASALTTAKLTATTRADESRVFGVSGVFTREMTLQVDHAFRRWLLATVKLLYGNDDYVGSTRDDNRYSVSAGITYKLNRELWLKSEYRHDWLNSSVPGASYSADVILVGLRAQR